MLGCGGGRGDVGRGIRGVGKCVGEVRGDVGKGEVREMWVSVGGSVVGAPHPNTLP